MKIVDFRRQFIGENSFSECLQYLRVLKVLPPLGPEHRDRRYPPRRCAYFSAPSKFIYRCTVVSVVCRPADALRFGGSHESRPTASFVLLLPGQINVSYITAFPPVT